MLDFKDKAIAMAEKTISEQSMSIFLCLLCEVTGFGIVLKVYSL